MIDYKNPDQPLCLLFSKAEAKHGIQRASVGPRGKKARDVEYTSCVDSPEKCPKGYDIVWQGTALHFRWLEYISPVSRHTNLPALKVAI